MPWRDEVESRLFSAEVKVTGTTDIPEEPCTMCGSRVGEYGLWVIVPRPFNQEGDPYDTVLHLECAHFLGANAEVLKRLIRE